MLPINYEFNGMNPSEWTEDFVENELKTLSLWAPTGSQLKLNVGRFSKQQFEGKLVLHSESTAFVVEAKHNDLSSLIKSLRKKMKSQLTRWKEASQPRYNGSNFKHAS